MKRSFIFISFFLLFLNCAQILHKKPLSTDTITIREIRNRVEQNYWNLKSIKGRAHLSIETPGIGFTAVSSIAFKLPDSLNINVKAGFGMGVGTVSIRKDSFTVYSSFENIVYRGDIHTFDVSRFIQIDMNVKDLLGFISGIPLIPVSKNASLQIDKEKYLIIVKSDSFLQHYWVDPKKFVVTDFQFHANDELLIEQQFRQFSKEKNVLLPRIIRISVPREQQRVTLFYTDRKTNKKINPEDFIIKVPQNSKVIDL